MQTSELTEHLAKVLEEVAKVLSKCPDRKGRMMSACLFTLLGASETPAQLERLGDVMEKEAREFLNQLKSRN